MKDSQKDIEELEKLAKLMDSKFCLPGTSISFGLDSMIGLIPGVGDTVTFISTAYIIGKAQKYELPWHIKFRMIWNGFLDWLIGMVPLIGDIFDIGWKANLRNVKLLKDYLEARSIDEKKAS